MRWYLARTVGQYSLVLFLAITLNFALPRLAPGSVVDFVVPPAEAGSLSPQQRQAMLEQFGLADPVPRQFLNYLIGIPQGDLGYSVIHGRPVAELLLERLPWTLLLVGTALLLSVWIGTALGFRSGWRRGRARDVGTLSIVMLLDSMPPFFVALLLVLAFSIHLGMFPVYGAIPTVPSSGFEFVVEVGQRLVLPVMTLTIVSIGSIYLVARPALVSEAREDYVLMAEAKGLDERGIRRHARRNALIPVTTVAMISVGDIVGGATVIETVFSYPGLGRLIYESVLARDYPVLQGAFFFLAMTVILANLITDLVYPRLDPRIRPARAGAQR
jgi:peptide/nickel transport system permease protein